MNGNSKELVVHTHQKPYISGWPRGFAALKPLNTLLQSRWVPFLAPTQIYFG